MESITRENYTSIILALIVGVVIGFFLSPMIMGNNEASALQATEDTEIKEVDSTLVVGGEDEAAFTIQIDSLPPEQRMMLKGAGVGGDRVVITNGMVACAENEMGAKRVLEIKNGAEISLTEGAALVGCYTKN